MIGILEIVVQLEENTNRTNSGTNRRHVIRNRGMLEQVHPAYYKLLQISTHECKITQISTIFYKPVQINTNECKWLPIRTNA